MFVDDLPVSAEPRSAAWWMLNSDGMDVTIPRGLEYFLRLFLQHLLPGPILHGTPGRSLKNKHLLIFLGSLGCQCLPKATIPPKLFVWRKNISPAVSVVT